MEPTAILETELRALRARVSKLEADLAQARERLPGLEHAITLLSGRSSTEPSRSRAEREDLVGLGSRAGRQPGAISNRWKDVLARLYGAHDVFRAEDVVDTVKALENRDMRTADVRRVLESHMTHGYVEVVDGGYSVSRFAADKFGLKRETTDDKGPAVAGPGVQIEGEAGLPEGPTKAAPTGSNPVSSTQPQNPRGQLDDQIPF